MEPTASRIGPVIDELFAVIESRRDADPEHSYTARLLTGDEDKLLKKIGEEATEVVMAAKDHDRDHLRYEAGDLLYHLLVVMAREGLDPDQLAVELAGRRRWRPAVVTSPLKHNEALWERVDDNRRRLVWTALVFVGVGALCAYIMGWVLAILVAVLSLRIQNIVIVDRIWRTTPLIAAAVGILGVAAALLWVVVALAFSDKIALRLMKAVRVPPGQLPELKSVLKDMSIAAGIPVAPEPWIVPSSGINAGVVARAGHRPVLVITEKLARLDTRLQRAVFANLLARVITGDAAWGTVGAALAGPAFFLRDSDLRRGDSVLIPDEDAHGRSQGNDPFLSMLGFVLYVPLIVVTQVMAGMYRRDADVLAETADAQGMLLLKDPGAMLDALEKILPGNNCVPGTGGAFGLLFYAWPDWEAPIGAGDPELRRVARLKQVLGAEGYRPSIIADPDPHA